MIDSKKKSDLEKKSLVFKKVGKGDTTLVFLHGLLGSHRYWTSIQNQLSSDHEMIAVDLLGFGDSPKPYLKYTVQEHVDYLLETLKHAGVGDKKIIIIGHSMGALLALNLANSMKGQVLGLMLINPPIVTAKDDLEQDLKNSSSKFMVGMTFSKTWGKFICAIHEMAPVLFYPIIKLSDPELTPDIAMDVTKHTWESFIGSLENVLENQRFFELLGQASSLPILLITSQEDAYSKNGDLDRIQQKQNIEFKSVPGDHNFLLRSPIDVSDLIRKFEQNIL